jgi:hypothetical protein
MHILQKMYKILAILRVVMHEYYLYSEACGILVGIWLITTGVIHVSLLVCLLNIHLHTVKRQMIQCQCWSSGLWTYVYILMVWGSIHCFFCDC